MATVITAKTAGFCFGVKRAIDIVEKEIEKRESLPIYTYGPIIHNETVVEDLMERGVNVMEEDRDPGSYPAGTVILRSHGVAKSVIEALEGAGHTVIDATCPFVKKIHRIVSEHSKAGEHILIIGNKDHPEVRGIVGWIDGEDFTVIDSVEEARKFAVNQGKQVCLVAQTTYNIKKFQDLVEIVSKKGYDIIALSTICNATEERQAEAGQIAGEVDVMLVIGSKNSSNSRKLFEICKAECDNTYFIQTEKELESSVLQSIHTIGITAGASSPNKIIEEVQKKCL